MTFLGHQEEFGIYFCLLIDGLARKVFNQRSAEREIEIFYKSMNNVAYTPDLFPAATQFALGENVK